MGVISVLQFLMDGRCSSEEKGAKEGGGRAGKEKLPHTMKLIFT